MVHSCVHSHLVVVYTKHDILCFATVSKNTLNVRALYNCVHYIAFGFCFLVLHFWVL